MEQVESTYQQHRPKHLLPFIGSAYEGGAPNTFRVLACGLNAYLWDGHPQGDALPRWYPDRWAEAGLDGTKHFFKTAYHEIQGLAAALTHRSRLFRGLAHDDSAKTKSGLYGTNFIKVFLGKDYTTAANLTDRQVAKSRPSWLAELAAMHKHQVFPHLIVVFGNRVWAPIWQSLYPGQTDLPVVEFETTDRLDPAVHHANRVRLQSGSSVQNTLLVRLTHPSAYRRVRGGRRDGAWLLGQPEVRRIAEME